MKHTLTLAALALSTAAFSQTFFDDFNRADGAPGANWVHTGTGPAMTIISNEITGSGTGNGLTLVNSTAFIGNFDVTQVQADFRVTDNSSTLAYSALAIGHNGVTAIHNGIFVKLQRQTAGPNFSHIGIYTGSGSNSSAITTTGGNFQVLASPFAAARLTLRANSPTELYTGIDTDFNGTDEFSYVSTLNLGTLQLGNRVGMHFWGSLSRGDNFNASVVPEPATIAVLGLGALGLLLRRRK